MGEKKYKIVFCTPALYMAGGVERVLTLKANYFAEQFDYDITIILTEGKEKPLFYPLSNKIKVVNLGINFEDLWTCSFFKKVFLYLKKQWKYKKKLKKELLRIRPDITDSLLRREINFINDIQDGSKKIGELHVNRANYRNFEANETNYLKELFSRFWIASLVKQLKRLDKFVVLTEEDKTSWTELSNVIAIPNPISFETGQTSPLTEKRVLLVGRYAYQKGIDLLLKAWAIVEKECPDWQLAVYGAGEREPYEKIKDDLGIDPIRCHLNGNTSKIQYEYLNSSLFVISSRFEGLSMAMLEALSCGLPVVSFACPCGPQDVIEDGINGFLVPKEDIQALAKSMIQVMKSPEMIHSMGHAAKRRSEDFKMDVIANRWKQLFESL